MTGEFPADGLVAPRVCPVCRQAGLVPLAAILYAVAGDGRVRCEACGAFVCVRPDCLPTLSLVDRDEWDAWDADDPEAPKPRTLRLLTIRAVQA